MMKSKKKKKNQMGGVKVLEWGCAKSTHRTVDDKLD